METGVQCGQSLVLSLHLDRGRRQQSGHTEAASCAAYFPPFSSVQREEEANENKSGQKYGHHSGLDSRNGGQKQTPWIYTGKCFTFRQTDDVLIIKRMRWSVTLFPRSRKAGRLDPWEGVVVADDIDELDLGNLTFPFELKSDIQKYFTLGKSRVVFFLFMSRMPFVLIIALVVVGQGIESHLKASSPSKVTTERSP